MKSAGGKGGAQKRSKQKSETSKAAQGPTVPSEKRPSGQKPAGRASKCSNAVATIQLPPGSPALLAQKSADESSRKADDSSRPGEHIQAEGPRSPMTHISPRIRKGRAAKRKPAISAVSADPAGLKPKPQPSRSGSPANSLAAEISLEKIREDAIESLLLPEEEVRCEPLTQPPMPVETPHKPCLDSELAPPLAPKSPASARPQLASILEAAFAASSNNSAAADVPDEPRLPTSGSERPANARAGAAMPAFSPRRRIQAGPALSGSRPPPWEYLLPVGMPQRHNAKVCCCWTAASGSSSASACECMCCSIPLYQMRPS